MTATTPIPISDTQLNVVQRGVGRVVLLVHGFPLDHSMWIDQLQDLSSHYRVIAPDLRGFGASPADVGPSLGMTRLADDLSELLGALQIEGPVIFVGFSMGGYVAWEFFRRHRDQLAGLILCDTRAAADRPDVAQGRRALADRVLREGTQVVSDDMVKKLFADPNGQQPAKAIELTRAVMNRTAPQSIAAALRGMAERIDMCDQLSEINCPTLALGGQHDRITPADEMEAMAAAIPAATWEPIPAAGHMAPLENPSVVNRAIRDFLQTRF